MKASRFAIVVFLGVAAVAVVGSLAVWNRTQLRVESDTGPIIDGELGNESALESDVVMETPGDVAAEPGEEAPARRIVQVPDTRRAATESEPVGLEDVSGANIAGMAARSAEKALDGDLRSARNLTGLMTLCRHLVPADEETLEREIQRITEMAETSASMGNPIPADGQPYTSMPFNSAAVAVRMFPTEAQNRRHLTEWYVGCRKVHGLFDEEMREELAALARSGHVTARYLYAMWGPELRLGKDALEHRMQWQINAFEFSYANLEEGEVAGLLAFSQSYMEGIFTGIDIGLSLATAKAALECGYESEEIRRYMERYVDDSETEFLRRWAGLTPNEFEVLVTAFVERCR